MNRRPRVAFAWCASCGGCEEAVLDADLDIVEALTSIELVYWPALIDAKRADLERLDDNDVDLCFVNGGIRTTEQRDLVLTLRRVSRVLVAFGACATSGGVPGLANLRSRDALIEAKYRDAPTLLDNAIPAPARESVLAGQTLRLPDVMSRVSALHEVVTVDCDVPGCAPAPAIVAEALQAFLSGSPSPHPQGATIGPSKALCETCFRRGSMPTGRTIDRIIGLHEIEADAERCFLDQGILCCGPATRGGCGEPCLQANAPCTGCSGPPRGVKDQGARLLAMVASLYSGRTRREATALVEQVLDPAGRFSRYGVATSITGGRIE